MFKKTLISLAVASSLGLTGCFDSGSDTKNANPDPKYTDPAIEGKTWPIFNPATRQLPTPTDLSFSGSLDGTFLIDLEEDSPAPAVALDSLSGGSTVDPIILRTNGQLPDSATDANLIPNQTVFLIPLQYASNDPVQGLSNREIPTVDLAKAANTKFKVDVITLDGDSAIKIAPTEPLAPNTRYVIGVTKSVVDVNGDSIISDPVYSNFSSEDAGLISSSLAPIRTLANNLWEPTIIGYAANLPVGALSLEQDDIAVSYSMTTSNDVQVLKYLANKELWLADQLENLVRVSAAKTVVGAALFASGEDLVEDNVSPLSGLQKWDLNRDGNVNAADFDFNKDGQLTSADFLLDGDNSFGFTDIQTAVNAALATFKPSTLGVAGCDTGTPEERFSCAAGELSEDINDGLSQANISIAQPSVRDYTPGDSKVINRVSAVVAGVLEQSSAGSSELVSLSESTITLPYYLGLPTAESGAAIQSSGWKADSDFAGFLNAVPQFAGAGLVLPQAKTFSKGDNAGELISTAVNSRFPFPAETAEVEVPMVILHPNFDADNFDGTPFDGATLQSLGAITDVVIFQHGITTDRSAALAFGSALIANGLSQNKRIAVVAIDQPLHGVAPATLERKQEIASTLLQQAPVLLGPLSTYAANTESNVAAVIEGSFVVQFIIALAAGEESITLSPTQAQQVLGVIASGTPSGDSDVNTIALNYGTSIGAIVVAQNTVANSGSTVPGLAPKKTTAGFDADGINERHFGWGSNPEFNRTIDVGPTNLPFAAMQFNPADDNNEPGASGDLFINLGNFLNSRDNLRQGTLDLLNLRATLPSVPAFSGAKFHFVGHSLGTVNGNAFVVAANASGNTDLELASSHLMTPASGLVRMLENSPSFAPSILAGLKQQAGLTQADSALQSFFGVFQAAIDTVDPINFVEDLQISNTLISQIDGDRTTINAAFEPYIQVAADASFATNFEEGYLPFSAMIGNLVIDSPEAPLAGSEPLAAFAAAGAFPALPAITRYEQGTHGTPLLPRPETTEAPNFAEFEFEFLKNRELSQGGDPLVDQAGAATTFSGLVGQTLQLIIQTTAP